MSVTQWFEYPGGKLDRNVYRGPASALIDTAWRSYTGDDPTNQALSRLQSQTSLSSGSFAVGLAEAEKTAAHLAHTATRLVNAYRDLKKGRLGDFARGVGLTVNVREIRAYRNRWRRKQSQGTDMQQFAANSWLEYSYGWKPLIKDFHDQAENLARYMMNHNGVIQTARATATSGERLYVETSTDGERLWRSVKQVRVVNRVSFVVNYKVPNGANDFATTFGMVNPALVAWEIVPFSFVADWFLPVGDFLESLTAFDGLLFHSGTKTTTQRGRIDAHLELLEGSTSGGRKTWATGLGGGTGFNDIVTKDRIVLTGFPRKTLQPKDPRSFAHAASAIALIQTVFRGSRSRDPTVVRYVK